MYTLAGGNADTSGAQHGSGQHIDMLQVPELFILLDMPIQLHEPIMLLA